MLFETWDGSTSQPMSLTWNPNARVGLMISGGLDSAVLLAALLHASQTEKIPLDLQLFSVKKQDGGYQYVPEIASYLSKKFNVPLRSQMFVGNGELHHRLVNQSGIDEIFAKGLAEEVFIGINPIPPIPLPGLAPIRSKTIGMRGLRAPFLKMYKTHILNLALQLDCAGLFPLTHTCTQQPTGSCGICWACSERKWAFDQMNLNDPDQRESAFSTSGKTGVNF